MGGKMGQSRRFANGARVQIILMTSLPTART